MMLDEKKNTPFDTVSDRRTVRTPLRTHPSLLPLRMALIAAAGESPACPPRMDVNEQRAMQLIAKVKAEYKKQQFVMNWHDIPSPYGLHVDLQAMVNSNA